MIPRFKPKAQDTLGHFGTTELMGESGTLKDCPSVPARKGEGREKHRYSGTNQPRVLLEIQKMKKSFFLFLFFEFSRHHWPHSGCDVIQV